MYSGEAELNWKDAEDAKRGKIELAVKNEVKAISRELK